MMFTYVRGHFKDVHGTLNFDPKSPAGFSVAVVIDARKTLDRKPARDEHLRGLSRRRKVSRNHFPRKSGNSYFSSIVLASAAQGTSTDCAD